MRTQQQRAADKLAKEQRTRDVMQLRVAGASMPEIARQLNLSVSTVHSHISKALDALAKADQAQTARLRAMSMQRLDRLLMACWTKATAGDMKAVREARFLVIAQGKLLGLEAPVKIAHTDPTGEIERSPQDWIMPVPPEMDPQAWATSTQAMLRDREAAAERLVEEVLANAGRLAPVAPPE